MSAVPLSLSQAPYILVLDIGTSSLRAVVYDSGAREVDSLFVRRKYLPDTTDDGGSTLDARAMLDALTSALDELILQIRDRIPISAVAASSLASNVLALDAQGEPLTPAYLYADTRNARAVEQLRSAYAWSSIYARTGCPLHTSYLPARFLWLRETAPETWSRAAHFVSLHEYFLLTLFSRAVVSHSFAAWTGMLNHAAGDWDPEVLNIAGIGREHLSPVSSVGSPLIGLRDEYASRWKMLANIPWYPALGDGAAANVGSGCVDESRVAITVGTSGAMRIITPAGLGLQKLPPGLWMYRLDERDGLLGGSLTDGGSIFEYFSRTLQVPATLERVLEQMPPDAHGLTMLPFFAGERSPGYHGDARAALTGWNLDTSPAELWRAALEAVAYRFAAIHELLRTVIPPPRQVIASGAALLTSRVWIQILADVLNVPVTASGAEEASARGAAIVALRSLRALASLDVLPAPCGETYTPDPSRFEIYRRARERQKSLYHLILDNRPHS